MEISTKTKNILIPSSLFLFNQSSLKLILLLKCCHKQTIDTISFQQTVALQAVIHINMFNATAQIWRQTVAFVLSLNRRRQTIHFPNAIFVFHV